VVTDLIGAKEGEPFDFVTTQMEILEVFYALTAIENNSVDWTVIEWYFLKTVRVKSNLFTNQKIWVILTLEVS